MYIYIYTYINYIEKVQAQYSGDQGRDKRELNNNI